MLTLDYIKRMGYPQAREEAKEVFVLENFMTQEEIDELMLFVESASQEDWESEYQRNLVLFAERKFKRTDIDNLVKEGKLEITDNWNDKTIVTPREVQKKLDYRLITLFKAFPDVQVNGSGILQRQYTGVPLIAHVDNHTDPSLVYAAVFYVNDNYNGGNVYFSNLGLEMKPKAGTIVIFPTGEDHLHGVKAVEDGPTRYVIPSFVGKRNFYEENTF
jgi:hypothetical protein